jgi:hypothetical protein
MSVIKRSGITRLLTLMVSLATATLISGTGTATAAPPEVIGKKTVQVRGTAADGSKFNGQYTVTSFRPASAANPTTPVEAVGDLTGKLIRPGQGQGAQDVSQDPASRGVAMPAAVAQTGCEILDLVLGPVDLNLLGLVVHLDVVHLNITAVPGAGNLLGNLLCGVAGLLDPLNLDGLVALLNQILGLLGG